MITDHTQGVSRYRSNPLIKTAPAGRWKNRSRIETARKRYARRWETEPRAHSAKKPTKSQTGKKRSRKDTGRCRIGGSWCPGQGHGKGQTRRGSRLRSRPPKRILKYGSFTPVKHRY